MEAGLAYELIASRSDLEQIIAAARQSAPEPDVRTLTAGAGSWSAPISSRCSAGRVAVAVGGADRLELHPTASSPLQ